MFRTLEHSHETIYALVFVRLDRYRINPHVDLLVRTAAH